MIDGELELCFTNITKEKIVGAFHEQIAALQTRLRSAEEDVKAARREALLEGQAKSLTEVEAACKKAAEASDKAEALRNRCSQQVREGK